MPAFYGRARFQPTEPGAAATVRLLLPAVLLRPALRSPGEGLAATRIPVDCVLEKLRIGCETELALQTLTVRLDGLDGEAQALGRLARGEPAADETEHL